MRIALSLLASLVFLSVPAGAVPQTTSPIAGPVVAEIAGGDVLHPRFSPDGKTLAYTKVNVVDGTERDEVYLYSLDTGRTVRLLDSKTSADYETYSAFVTDMEWEGPRRLGVCVADGDVDSTWVTIDTRSKKIVGERANPTVDDFEPGSDQWFTDETRSARDLALKTFPGLDRSTLDAALADGGGFATPDGRIVCALPSDDGSPRLTLVDPAKRSRTLLETDMPGDDDVSAGTYFGTSLVVLTPSGRIVQFDANGRSRRLGTLGAKPEFPTIDVVHRSSDRLMFSVRQYHGAKRGDNPLFVFDGSRLVRSSDYPELVDATVDPAGRHIAFCFWKADDTRAIVIRRLAGAR